MVHDSDRERFFEEALFAAGTSDAEVGAETGAGVFVENGDVGEGMLGAGGGDVEDAFGIVVVEGVGVYVYNDGGVGLEAFELAGGGEEDAVFAGGGDEFVAADGSFIMEDGFF